MSNTILKVKDLSVSFTQYSKGLNEVIINPVKSLNIEINSGEILAIVGASGSGKSLLAHAIMGILPPNSTVHGTILYKNEILDEKRLKAFRGNEIGFIPQSVNYLDPSMKAKHQVQINLPKDKKKIQQELLFQKYGLEKSDGDLYPYQLSGGMLRRVLFATSIRENVKLIIADEPTPGIHPEVLNVILGQLKEIANKGVAIMFITHDIFSAIKIADNIAIFKDGENIETAPSSFYEGNGDKLKQEYSKKLWRSLPQNDFIEEGDLHVS